MVGCGGAGEELGRQFPGGGFSFLGGEKQRGCKGGKRERSRHEVQQRRVPEIEVEAHAARGANGKIHLEVCRLHAEV